MPPMQMKLSIYVRVLEHTTQFESLSVTSKCSGGGGEMKSNFYLLRILVGSDIVTQKTNNRSNCKSDSLRIGGLQVKVKNRTKTLILVGDECRTIVNAILY